MNIYRRDAESRRRHLSLFLCASVSLWWILLPKNLGDAFRVPRFVSSCRAFSVSSCRPFLPLSSWLPWFLFSLPFFMDCATFLLLRLIECIESIKSDVKKKNAFAGACDPYTKVTGEGWRRILLACESNSGWLHCEKCLSCRVPCPLTASQVCIVARPARSSP